jgi:hypothetical protein
LLAVANDDKAPSDLREVANREHYRRILERAQHNLKDEATAAVVYRIKVKGMDREIVGAKHCGNGVKKNDPIGDASPAETAETRAARRACRQLIDTFPDLRAEMDVIEAEAKLVSVEVMHAEARRRHGVKHVKMGDYEGSQEVSGTPQGILHAAALDTEPRTDGDDGYGEDDRDIDRRLIEQEGRE